MAFRSLIETQVNNLFEILGDLAVDVTLTQVDATGYDFASGRVRTTQGGTSVVRGVLLTGQTVPGSDTNRIADVLIIRSADVDDISKYDEFTIGNRQFRIQNYSDNGYTIECQVSGV